MLYRRVCFQLLLCLNLIHTPLVTLRNFLSTTTSVVLSDWKACGKSAYVYKIQDMLDRYGSWNVTGNVIAIFIVNSAHLYFCYHRSKPQLKLTTAVLSLTFWGTNMFLKRFYKSELINLLIWKMILQ